jgi:hypothetical protein
MISILVTESALGDIAEEFGLTVKAADRPHDLYPKATRLSVEVSQGKGRVEFYAISRKAGTVPPPVDSLGGVHHE